MSIQEDYFIVDGIFHVAMPESFSQVTEETFGAMVESYQTADGFRMIATQSPQILDYGDYRDYYHRRKILVQLWQAEWGEDSLMDAFMAEHLMNLYQKQTRFWVQYDDEMTRCYGRLIGLNADLENALEPHAYFTPHYPIFPYGHEPPDDPEAAGVWDGHLLVAGKEWVGDYTVYPDYGLVLIDADGKRWNDRIKAHLKYTWRGYVRISSLDLQPFQLAQTYYTGRVVFEQVPISISGVALAWKDAPYIGVCTFYAQERIRTFEEISVAAKVAGTRVGEVKEATTVVSVLDLNAIHAEGEATNVQLVFGTAEVADVVITATAVAESTVPTVQINGPTESVGYGWSQSTYTITAAQILSDGNDYTYLYGTGYSQTFILAEFEDPLVTSGHTVRVKWRRTVGATTKLSVYLMQGARVVGSATFTRSTDGNAVDTFTLTGGEAATITDYSDLRVVFYADLQAIVCALEMEMPVEGGVVVKERSSTGSIAVSAVVEALRSIVVGYPEIAVVEVDSVYGGIVAQKVAEPPEE